MNRKAKRDEKNARHRSNEQRRQLRRMIHRHLPYTWQWSRELQNAEAMMWRDFGTETSSG
jgi:hypothetical protein